MTPEERGGWIYENYVLHGMPVSGDQAALVRAYLDSPCPYHERVQSDIDLAAPYTLIGFARFSQQGTALHVWRPLPGGPF